MSPANFDPFDADFEALDAAQEAAKQGNTEPLDQLRVEFQIHLGQHGPAPAYQRPLDEALAENGLQTVRNPGGPRNP